MRSLPGLEAAYALLEVAARRFGSLARPVSPLGIEHLAVGGGRRGAVEQRLDLAQRMCVDDRLEICITVRVESTRRLVAPRAGFAGHPPGRGQIGRVLLQPTDPRRPAVQHGVVDWPVRKALPRRRFLGQYDLLPAPGQLGQQACFLSVQVFDTPHLLAGHARHAFRQFPEPTLNRLQLIAGPPEHGCRPQRLEPRRSSLCLSQLVFQVAQAFFPVRQIGLFRLDPLDLAHAVAQRRVLGQAMTWAEVELLLEDPRHVESTGHLTTDFVGHGGVGRMLVGEQIAKPERETVRRIRARKRRRIDLFPVALPPGARRLSPHDPPVGAVVKLGLDGDGISRLGFGPHCSAVGAADRRLPRTVGTDDQVCPVRELFDGKTVVDTRHATDVKFAQLHDAASFVCSRSSSSARVPASINRRRTASSSGSGRSRLDQLRSSVTRNNSRRAR